MAETIRAIRSFREAFDAATTLGFDLADEATPAMLTNRGLTKATDTYGNLAHERLVSATGAFYANDPKIIGAMNGAFEQRIGARREGR